MKSLDVGRWSVPRPDGMELIQNEDSVQLVGGGRVIYLSEMRISGERSGVGTTAAELHAAFRRAQPHDHELSGPDAFGFAGSILTCVFSLSSRKDIDWALSIWRDIKPTHPA